MRVGAMQDAAVAGGGVYHDARFAREAARQYWKQSQRCLPPSRQRSMSIASLRQDLRYTVRTLRRDAGFTAFAILIAGLGIGASATVFSVVNALLLRPLPFTDPERWSGSPTATPAGCRARRRRSGTCSTCGSGRRRCRRLAGYFAFYGVGDNLLSGRGEPERLSGVPVSDNFFEVLGVQPQLGRTFNARGVPVARTKGGDARVTASGSAASMPIRRSSGRR